MGYALNALSERATMFVDPGVEVYEGMIIGMNSRKDDMTVNPCKNKKQSNVRASGSDDAIKLAPPRIFTLEEALEFIDEDELVEITPEIRNSQTFVLLVQMMLSNLLLQEYSLLKKLLNL